jgi:hypothetical protein
MILPRFLWLRIRLRLTIWRLLAERALTRLVRRALERIAPAG